MPTVTVTVAGTEAPAAGKKRGRIKDTSGALYQALPSYLNMVRIGSVYDLTYKDDEFNGTKFRVVEGVTPSMGAPTPPRQSPSYSAPQGHSAPEQDERGTDIATLAIAKVWLEKIPVGDAAAAAHALRASRRAWLMFKRNPDNVESSRQPTQSDKWEEFPEQ